MKTTTRARALAAALIGLSLTGAPKPAFADIKDYEFQLVDQTVKAGADKVITVRLVNKKTGKPVPDAVIFATRLDMAPDGMQEMVTKVDADAGDRARHLPVQGELQHGGPLAAVARRQGAGRDRHGRKQARRHGAEMNRAVAMAVAAAICAAAGAGFVATRQRDPARASSLVDRAAAKPARRSTTGTRTASRSIR